jgi:hypothetical protein
MFAGAAGSHVVEAEDDSAAEVVHDEGVLQVSGKGWLNSECSSCFCWCCGGCSGWGGGVR